MNIAILGRTKWLIDAADRLLSRGHRIVAVATNRTETHYKVTVNDFADLAERAEAAFLGSVSLHNAGVRERLRACGADIAISINWPVIVEREVIDIFPRGILNAHCGDLPRYRGNACPNWAILNREPRIGLCSHLMADDDVDTGPVVLRDFLEVDERTYIGDVYAWLDDAIPSILTASVDGLASGRLTATPQPKDPSLALRCFPRRPEDGRINWRTPAEAVGRLVRASSVPFGGAFGMTEDGRTVTIWRARAQSTTVPFCATPGQIMIEKPDRVFVACGEGALLLEDIEVDGLRGEAALQSITSSFRARLV